MAEPPAAVPEAVSESDAEPKAWFQCQRPRAEYGTRFSISKVPRQARNKVAEAAESSSSQIDIVPHVYAPDFYPDEDFGVAPNDQCIVPLCVRQAANKMSTKSSWPYCCGCCQKAHTVA